MKLVVLVACAAACGAAGMALRSAPPAAAKIGNATANSSKLAAVPHFSSLHSAMSVFKVGNLTQNSSKVSVSQNTTSSEDALSAAMSVLNSVNSERARLAPISAPIALPAGSAASSHPSKLDVGFTDFDQNLTAMVDKQVRNATTEAPWTAPLRERLVANVTQTVSLGLKASLKPLKQSIAKTWMALPQDEQKDIYVGQLRNSFIGVFASSLETVQRHLSLSLHHLMTVSALRHSEGTEELLARTETGVAESLLGEHCYSDSPRKPTPAAQAKAKDARAGKASLAQVTQDEAFCIQSVLGSLVHRLNDTSSLISMTMRFEAGAMSLAQQRKK